MLPRFLPRGHWVWRWSLGTLPSGSNRKWGGGGALGLWDGCDILGLWPGLAYFEIRNHSVDRALDSQSTSQVFYFSVEGPCCHLFIWQTSYFFDHMRFCRRNPVAHLISTINIRLTIFFGILVWLRSLLRPSFSPIMFSIIWFVGFFDINIHTIVCPFEKHYGYCCSESALDFINGDRPRCVDINNLLFFRQ